MFPPESNVARRSATTTKRNTRAMESIGYQLNATNIVSIIFVLGFVAARLLTKAFVTRSTGWDDCRIPPSSLHLRLPANHEGTDTCVIAACLGVGRTVADTLGASLLLLPFSITCSYVSQLSSDMALEDTSKTSRKPSTVVCLQYAHLKHGSQILETEPNPSSASPLTPRCTFLPSRSENWPFSYSSIESSPLIRSSDGPAGSLDRSFSFGLWCPHSWLCSLASL